MQLRYLLLVLVATAVLWHPVSLGAETITVSALIDGISHLHLGGNSAMWHHIKWQAPGLFNGANEPTVINGVDWYAVFDHNWCNNCWSDTFSGVVPALPAEEVAVTLTPVLARESVSIVEGPTASNDYTLVVEFNDDLNPGADWYEVQLEFDGPLPPNNPPTGQCTDVVELTSPQGSCLADAQIDNGSFDPDGDAITLVQTPPGPYRLGDTVVTLTVTDSSGASDTCAGTVTVIDAEAPVVYCNSPTTITPPDVPISFIATATDNCEVSRVSIESFECYRHTPSGRRVDDVCDASIARDTITISDTGGISSNIEWDVTAIDTSGNFLSISCGTQSTRPTPGSGISCPCWTLDDLQQIDPTVAELPFGWCQNNVDAGWGIYSGIAVENEDFTLGIVATAGHRYWDDSYYCGFVDWRATPVIEQQFDDISSDEWALCLGQLHAQAIEAGFPCFQSCPCWEEEWLTDLRYPSGDPDELASCGISVDPNQEYWMIQRFEGPFSLAYDTTMVVGISPTKPYSCVFSDVCDESSFECLQIQVVHPEISPEETAICQEQLTSAGVDRGFTCWD